MVNQLRQTLQTAQSNNEELKEQLARLSELGRLKNYGGGRKKGRRQESTVLSQLTQDPMQLYNFWDVRFMPDGWANYVEDVRDDGVCSIIMKAIMEKVPHRMSKKHYYDDTNAPMAHVKYWTIKSIFTNVGRKAVMITVFVVSYFGKLSVTHIVLILIHR